MFRPFVCVAVVLALAAGAPAADDGPKEVIARAIEAHGGKELLTKHKAVHAKNKGKLDIPGIGETEFEQEVMMMLPDKLKETVELNINGQKVNVVTIANGDAYSIEVNGKEIDGGENVKKALKDIQYVTKVGRLVGLADGKGYELSLIGEDKVEGKAVVGVRVSAKGQKDVSLYFDKKTGLLTKLEYQTVDPANGNEIKEERIITEYEKNKDGIATPKKATVKRDGQTFLELEVKEWKYLEKLDDGEFKR